MEWERFPRAALRFPWAILLSSLRQELRLPINSEDRKQPVAAAMDIHAIALPAVHAFLAMRCASHGGRA